MVQGFSTELQKLCLIIARICIELRGINMKFSQNMDIYSKTSNDSNT